MNWHDLQTYGVERHTDLLAEAARRRRGLRRRRVSVRERVATALFALGRLFILAGRFTRDGQHGGLRENVTDAYERQLIGESRSLLPSGARPGAAGGPPGPAR